MNIIAEARKQQDFIVTIRRYLHENPELSKFEFNTLRLIKEELDKCNISYVDCYDGGILATIDSGKPGKTVLLRADIDALPIQEDNLNVGGFAKQCVSKVKGVSHVCGHDAHTAMLLAAARILSEHRDEFKGKIYLCFERAEEGIDGAFFIGKYFLEHNIKFDTCFGIHVSVSPNDQPGCILIREGNCMAAMCAYTIKIIGKGGHGGKPELCVSPVNGFTYVYQAIEELYKNYFNAPLRFSCGIVNSGIKENIIPDSLEFVGTIRYFDINIARDFVTKMIEVANNAAKQHGCYIEVLRLNNAGLPLVNDAMCCDIARKAFKDYQIYEAPLKTSSESFSYYQAFGKGVFVNLTTTNSKKGITSEIHDAKMEVDEDVLYLGTAAHLLYAFEFLNNDYNLPNEPLYKDVTDFENRFGKLF